MTKCDICGNTGLPLVDLLDQYQTRDIKQICWQCEKETNRHHSQLLEVAMKMKRTWLQRWLTNRRKALEAFK